MSYSLVMLLLLTSIISAIPSSIILVKAAGDYPSYEDCAPYTCANSTIQYPFGICGLLYAYCEDNQTFLNASFTNEDWRVVGHITKSSYFTQTLQITSWYDSASSYDWLLKGGFFHLSDAYMVGTIVNCRQPPADILVNNTKKLDCTESNGYCFFYPEAGFQIPGCDNYPLIVPTNKSYNISADKDFKQLRQTGFQITWSTPDYVCHSCEASGGRCYSQFVSQFYFDNTYCICPNDDVHSFDGIVVQYGKRLSAKDMAGTQLTMELDIIVPKGEGGGSSWRLSFLQRAHSCEWNSQNEMRSNNYQKPNSIYGSIELVFVSFMVVFLLDLKFFR